MKKAAKKSSKKSPSTRQQLLEEGVVRGKTPAKAARDAGYSESFARVDVYRTLANPSVQARIAARMAEARVETDEIVGTLASQMRVDLADILPDDELLARAKENGVSHLVKKLKRTRRLIPQKDDEPIEIVTHEFEVYSAQEAAKQLCVVKGLNKKEGENPEDERARVELAISAYIGRTGADRESAIKNLTPFMPEVSKYAN